MPLEQAEVMSKRRSLSPCCHVKVIAAEPLGASDAARTRSDCQLLMVKASA